MAKLLKTVIFLGLCAGGYYYWHMQEQKKEEEKKVNQYITEPVKRGDIAYKVNASGMVYPQKIIEIGAQVSGEISTMAVKVGDKVMAGDLIAEIDARSQRNAKETALAQLENHKAALATAKAEFERASKAYNRAAGLYKKGAGSKEDLENAQNSLNSAKNSITQAEANIKQSEITIANADLNLGYTKVIAPTDGTVISVVVEEGQTVNAVQSAPTLVKLAKTDVMTVKAEIAEADISAVRAGLPVSFTLLGKNTARYKGELASIDPAPKEISDNGSGITSSTAIYYYGHINVDNADAKLKYGMTATVEIEVEKSLNTLLVPMTALRGNPQRGQEVSVLVNNEPQPRKVETGLEDGVNVEILSGVKEGEKVIISTAGAGGNSFRPRGPRPF